MYNKYLGKLVPVLLLAVLLLAACDGGKKPEADPNGPDYQIGVRYTELDFLNPEQQEIYREAYELYPGMVYSTENWELARDENGFITAEIGGTTYYRMAGPYERWQDFESLWLETFTVGWFEEHNHYFKEIDGYTYVLVGAKSGPFAPIETYYEVGFVREDMIIFYVNAQYADEFFGDPEEVYRQEYHTIQLVQQESGWRCSEFAR